MRKLLLVALLVMGLAACARPAPDTLKIGSKPFPESELLADMLAILAQERGIPVTRIGNLGGTKITFDALKSGSIDVYPEYTGTGLMEILQQAATNDPNEALELVRQGFLKAYDIEWLEPLGFNNTYALAMKTAEMKALGIRTISQLAPKSGGLIFGCSHEFYDRPDGYPGLVEFYGLHFKKVERLQHGLAYQALLQDKIDLTDVYSTDGRLDPETMTVLVDDRHFFPPYYAAPVARREALLRFPAAREALNALAGRIDDPTMQRLNRQVEVEKVPSKEVALNFLRKQGLVRGEAGALQTGRGGDVAQVLWARRGEIAVLVGQHLALTGVAMGLAIAVGIPLGIVISRSVRLAAPVLVAAGVLQTIPS
ncbi:MAG: hypothetical protein FJX76_19575, partial [Armatimonadetes bacterium]|nr:hypothetical protein [Armatimonadota bacterium]